MKRHLTMKTSIPLIALAVLLGSAAAGTARAQDDTRLVVVQDESSTELRIEANLKTAHHMVVSEKRNGDDLWLDLPMKGPPMPGYHIVIDTQALNKGNGGAITERGIRIQLETGIKVSDPRHRAAVLEVINDMNRGKVFCSAYIDADTEVTLDWTLNILDPAGLDVEYVYDIVARETKLWGELYPQVAAAMQ